MALPRGDAELVQIVDRALAHAAQQAGSWLACRPGCTQCCYGAFPINALDVHRLKAALQAADPLTAGAIRQRARNWIETYGLDLPGDPRLAFSANPKKIKLASRIVIASPMAKE